MRYCIIVDKSGVESLPIPVDVVSIEKATNREKPCFIDKDGKVKNIKVFGLCPACKNPVQIIGLYKRFETKKPYAKHYGKTIDDIAKHDQDAYEACPYRKRREYNQNSKRVSGSALSLEIKARLIKHFDKVAYIIRKDTGIRYSKKLLKEMLKTYRGWGAWEYFGATLENIPWAFLYMTDSKSLFGQYIRKDGKLYSELKKRGVRLKENGEFVQIFGFDGKSFNLRHYFTKHVSEPKDGEFRESVEAVFMLNDEEILIQKIIFDHDYFFNLVNYGTWKSDLELLALAKEILE